MHKTVLRTNKTLMRSNTAEMYWIDYLFSLDPYQDATRDPQNDPNAEGGPDFLWLL